MFGDRETYLDNFETCAWSRNLVEQRIVQKFYEKEHIKSLLNKHYIMSVYNLSVYHCVTMFMYLKFLSLS